MIALVPALLLLLAPQPAASPGLQADTAELYQSCKAYTRVQEHENSHEDVYMAGYCSGYIKGYFAGVALLDGDRIVCASQASLPTLARVYTAYLDRHPRLFDQQPEVSFFGAMIESYPCPTKES